MSKEINVSRNKTMLDIDFIYNYLSMESYWAKGRSREDVVKSIENSICFGVFNEEQSQIGFARVITDGVVFAWIMDVFITDDYRERGIAKKLIKEVVNVPELKNVNGIGLRTNDAHGLYEKFGFKKIENSETWMLKNN
ncbi:GNAT family N-acetyltransferase [uncultured Croceitalea sp.]|uniref:GNAT family N-acetyltransferase n=1 Tax=uncultured Croceitalea sp. TaxID=1798908 RepID=UPI003305B26A